jgi:hypothetical protein
MKGQWSSSRQVLGFLYSHEDVYQLNWILIDSPEPRGRVRVQIGYY